jgi:flagellar basal-body rod protein FlgB
VTVSDGIMGVLQFAVDNVSLQQQTTANNIANDETPNFSAQQVSFEQSLQQAIDAPTGGTATSVVTTSTRAPGTNGNNVDLPTEMTQATQETMQYQSLVELLNAQFRLVQGAAGGSFS